MKPIVLLMLAASLTASDGIAAPLALRDFAYAAPLRLEGEAPFYDVELPAGIYRGVARADLADLRVFNGDGALVPMAAMPRVAPAREARPSFELTLFPLRSALPATDPQALNLSVQRSASGAFSLNLATNASSVSPGTVAVGERVVGFIADLGEKPEPLAALALRWDALPRSIGTRVRIDASDDLATWRTLVADAPLVDVEFQGKHLRRDRIDLPPSTLRYLRITWPGESAPLAIIGATGEHGDRRVAPTQVWIDAADAVAGERDGDLDFDLGAMVPVESLALIPAEPNTVAPVQLFTRVSLKEPWRHAGEGIVYRLRQGDADVDSTPLVLDGRAARYVRVHVDPASAGWGGKPPKLRAGWAARHAVFAARGSGPFLLAYGNAEAGPAALAIQTLVPGYGSASAPTIGIARVDLASGVMTPAALPPANVPDFKRLALWATLLLGVAALAAMAWHLSREMRDAAARPSAEPPPEG